MIHKRLSLILWLGLCASGLTAQSLQSIEAQHQAKLEATLNELRDLRSEIEAARLPLARELQTLDTEADALEKEAARAQRLKDSKQLELGTLRTRVAERQKEIDFVTLNLIPSYIADYDAALAPGERQIAGETIRNYNLYLEDVDAEALDQLEASLKLIEGSIEQLASNLGGRTFEGSAQSPNGNVLKGTFLKLGPLNYFANREQAFSGLVLSTGQTDIPEVQPVPKALHKSILATLETGAGELPIDPTLGDALAVAQTKDSIPEHLAKGGIWVYPILTFAFAATIVSIYKGIQVFSIRHPEPLVIHDIIKHLRAKRREEAEHLADAQPEPTRQMLMMAVDHASESTEMVEEVMYEAMLTTQPKLERFLNLIAVTAAAAPLLGLLGTVTGIIKTFRLMTVFGAGDPKPLISGISEALITTELGLILAIPALVMHAILSRKVAGIMARMEKTAVTFVNGLSRHGK